MENAKKSYSNHDIFNQYFSSKIISNDKLLLNSFSEEIWRGSRCVVPASYEEFFRNKVIFINTNNFKEIKSTEIFKEYINLILIQNLIIIQTYKNKEKILIYDANSLQEIQSNNFVDEFGIFYNLDDKYLISHPKYKNKDIFIIYEIKNNLMIKLYKIKSDIFERLDYRNYKHASGYNKNLLILKDKRIIICTYDRDNYKNIIILISLNIN